MTYLLIKRANDELVIARENLSRATAIKLAANHIFAAIPPGVHIRLYRTPSGFDVYHCVAQYKRRKIVTIKETLVYCCIITEDQREASNYKPRSVGIRYPD